MLPQRKNVSCLEDRRSPVRSTTLRTPREPIWGQTANRENSTRHAKKFSKSIKICGVWTKIRQAYLDCRRTGFFLSGSSPDRALRLAVRETTVHRLETMLEMLSYIDEDYVTKMTFFACLHACRSTSRLRIKLETQVRIAWNLIELNESRRYDY